MCRSPENLLRHYQDPGRGRPLLLLYCNSLSYVPSSSRSLLPLFLQLLINSKIVADITFQLPLSRYLLFINQMELLPVYVGEEGIAVERLLDLCEVDLTTIGMGHRCLKKEIQFKKNAFLWTVHTEEAFQQLKAAVS